MKRALITGITGQDGRYLSEFLAAKNYQVFGLLHGQSNPKGNLVQAENPRLEPRETLLLEQLKHRADNEGLEGTVADVRVEGLMAQVELVVDEPARLVAIVTADAVEELGLKPGMPATAVVKATSVMVEHS